MSLRSLLATAAALTAISTAPMAQEAWQPTEPGVYAAFETSMGDFTAVLFEDKAPITVENFIGLATGTKPWRAVDKTAPELAEMTQELISSGSVRTRAELNAALEEHYDEVFDLVEDTPFFDNTIFHRVIAGFMIQGGAPATVRHGASGPGFSIPDEFDRSLRHNRPGLLSMANAGANTGGSQFFVTVAPTPHLDDRHSIFGEVIHGYEVVDAISKVATEQGDRPETDVVVEHVEIIRIEGDDAAEAPEAEPTPAPAEEAAEAHTHEDGTTHE